MTNKTLLLNVIQYASAAFFCWLLISGQISDSAFMWTFLAYGLFNYLIRRNQRNPEEE
ncbi:MAG: hypothetical protein AB4050_12765 [Synechococcus sp.]